jgi:hypothetical protein
LDPKRRIWQHGTATYVELYENTQFFNSQFYKCFIPQDVVIDANNVVIEKGEMEEKPDILFYDLNKELGLYAEISVDDDDGEYYLTVDTDKTGTSCTLKLSTHADHGPVLVDREFGVFRFSPDGKYIMYAAEEKRDGDGRIVKMGCFLKKWDYISIVSAEHHLYRGSFYESTETVQPIIVIYEVI